MATREHNPLVHACLNLIAPIASWARYLRCIIRKVQKLPKEIKTLKWNLHNVHIFIIESLVEKKLFEEAKKYAIAAADEER